METPTQDPLIQEKYEALLSGILPSSYRDHILCDKISLLTKQNLLQENTILSLRHQLSTLIIQPEANSTNENKPSKNSPISAALKKLLEISEFEYSQFTEIHSRALEAVKITGERFSALLNKMKSKLFPPNKKLLDFMSTLLDQIKDIRSQLTSIHNYVAVLEYNEKMLRQRLARQEKGNKRCHSVGKIEEFEIPEKIVSKIYTRTVVESPSKNKSVEHRYDELIGKITKLKMALAKMKSQKDAVDIENQKMLLQLKQAKEQFALSEEHAAAKELEYKNKIKKLKVVTKGSGIDNR